MISSAGQLEAHKSGQRTAHSLLVRLLPVSSDGVQNSVVVDDGIDQRLFTAAGTRLFQRAHLPVVVGEESANCVFCFPFVYLRADIPAIVGSERFGHLQTGILRPVQCEECRRALVAELALAAHVLHEVDVAKQREVLEARFRKAENRESRPERTGMKGERKEATCPLPWRSGVCSPPP